MGDYIDIGGHPTWVETAGQQGNGSETVLLLHGGLSNSDELLNTIGAALAETYRVVAFDRRGHGRTGDTAGPFHYDDMAAETVCVLEQVVGGSAHLIGWSDGGIVAMLVALSRPDLARRLVLIGSNFHFDGVRPMELEPDSPIIGMMQSAYAERSPDGADHFGEVAQKSFAMFASEPTMTTDDVARITSPALVLVGDDDMIELSHTCALYESLPAGQLAVIPAASHAVPMEKPAEISRIIGDFLAGDAVPQTFMAVRRSASPTPSVS
jgi:pimeloyl-ACP methyl ester carboxylesterase